MNAWIVLADASRARVFAASDRRPLRLVRTLDHARSRLKGSEITTDKTGRIGNRDGSRGVAANHTPTREVEARHFAETLANYLKRSHGSRFSELALVAPPHFLGLLRQQIGHGLRRIVVASARKDLTELDEQSLPRHLNHVLARMRKAEREREQWV